MPASFTPPPLDTLEPESFTPPPPDSLEPLTSRDVKRLRFKAEAAESETSVPMWAKALEFEPAVEKEKRAAEVAAFDEVAPQDDNAVSRAARNIFRGVERGAIRMGGNVLDFTGAGAKLVGADTAAEKLTKGGKYLTETAEAIPRASKGYLDVDSLPEYFTYALETMAEQAPQLGLVGKALGKASQLAKGAKLGPKATAAAEVGAAVATIVPLEGGAAYREALESGAPSDRITAASSIATGVINGLLEGQGAEGEIAKLFGKGAKAAGRQTFRKFVADALLAAGRTAGVEAVTEAGQEAVTIANNKIADRTYDIINEFGKPENWRRITESAVAGGLVGLVAGGGVEALRQSPSAQPQQPPPPTSAPPAATAPRPAPPAPQAVAAPAPTANLPQPSSQLVVPAAAPAQQPTPAATTTFREPTPAQRSELEDLRGELEAAQQAQDLPRAQYVEEVLRAREQEFVTGKPAAAPPATVVPPLAPQPTPPYAAQNVVEPVRVSVQPPRADVVGQAQPAASTGNRIPDTAGGAAQGAVAAQAKAQTQPGGKEIIDLNQDRMVGSNAAGEPIYARADGSFYRMRSDRPRTRPRGYPDFGGDLNPVSQAASEAVDPQTEEAMDRISRESTAPEIYSLGSPATPIQRPSLSIKQAKEALNVFGFGGVPKGVEVTHRLDITRTNLSPIGTFNADTGQHTIDTSVLDGSRPTTLTDSNGKRIGEYNPATNRAELDRRDTAGTIDVHAYLTREVRGWYNPETRTIWLNAAFLHSAAEARAVFVEEAWHAIQNDPAIRRVMNRLLGSLTPEQLARARSVYGTLSEAALRQEAIADILEQESLTDEQRGMWEQLWLAIKDAITRLFGLVNPDWIAVETDARTAIAHALRRAGQNRQTNVRGGVVFSEQQRAAAAAFYSRLIRTVEQSQQNKASGAQWKATIKNSKLGANADEMALVGVNDLEDEKTYSKQEVLDYLSANQVAVKDVTLGVTEGSEEYRRLDDAQKAFYAAHYRGYDFDSPQSRQEWQRLTAARDQARTHFSTYQLPGAKEGSYREVLLTVPEKMVPRTILPSRAPQEIRQSNLGDWHTLDWYGEWSEKKYATQQEAQKALEAGQSNHMTEMVPDSNHNWQDGHQQYSSIANPIVRLRFNERTTQDGRRMLFLEEVQAPQKGQFEKMPPLFQKNWREIAFKWALRHAAENGFEAVGWTTGAQQAERYDLSKQVKSVDWVSYERDGGGKDIQVAMQSGDHNDMAIITDQSGKIVSGALNGKQLSDVLGKDIAEKILTQQEGKLEGDGLKIGGHGLAKLYDVDFRNVVNGLPAVKKAGQKVGTAQTSTGDIHEIEGGMWMLYTGSDNPKFNSRRDAEELSLEPIHSLTLTPDIAASVMGGQALFSLGAPANLSQAAVDIATTKVADMGQTALADWKAAAQRLDELGSQTPSFKAAHTSIKQQVDDAQATIMRMPSPDWTLLPKPAEGVAITGNTITVSPAFSDKLKALGVAHDPATVKDDQAELFFEQKAVQLTSMRRVLANREELLRYYESLPQASQDRLAGEIATLRKSIERQRRSIADLDKVDHAGTTLGTRSDEIESAQDGEIENRAKGAALSLQQVIETFGEPGEQRAGVLADIQSIIADPANTSEEVKTLRSLLGPGNLAEQFATLSEQQRDTVIASLATLLRQFDLNRASLQAVRNTSLTSLAKQADTFRRESGDVASERAKAEAMLEQSLRDALASASTLQTQAEIQELLNRLSAIVSFAQTVGSKPEANKTLYQWFATGPVGTPPAAGVSTASVGTDPLTLKMILDMAGKSPDFASAVGALIENKVKDASAADFKAISDAAKAGDSALAASLIGQLQQQANAAVTTIKGQQRAAARTLAAMAVQVRAMDNGITLFSQVAGSPAFGQLRSHVEANAGGFVIREIVDNATRTTFKEFGKLGVTPYSKEVSILPSVGEFPNRDDWQNRIQQWMTTAQQYVTAYSIAKHDFDTDPANPSPESLGYDAPTARGLQQALNSDMPIMLDWANYDPLKRLKSPWMLRMMQDHHVIGKIMRNPQRVWDHIGGLFGAKVRQAGSDLSHGELLGNRIHHRFKPMDALVGAAMRSHAADGIDNNIEAYRMKVWEELHHEARQFTGKVKVGFILPRSGLTVTKADMDALRSDVDFGNAVRRELEETRTDRGVVQNVGGMDYVRKGASPGDLPTPRTLSSMARGWANSLIAATEETPQADRAFSATTDLSATSPNKIVQFWNANPDALASHILDSARTDRTMTLDPLMAAAEQALSRDIRSRSESLPSSLEDLVQKLTFRLPPSGFMARDFVVRELGKELEQYHREAVEIADTDRAQQKNSGINVLISALNEYTKPAAKLRLPSNLYTYGSLTPGDRMFALKRGTHEKAVQLVVTISQAIADIGAALEYWNSLPAAERTDAREKVVFKQFGSLVEAEQSKRIVEAYLNDAIKKYELVREGSESGIEKVLKGGFRLTLGMLLAGATVAINNTVSASLPVFMAHSAASQLGAIGGFLAVSKYLVRLGVTSSLLATRALVSGGEFALDNTVRRWLGSGPGKKFLSGAIEGLTKKFLGLDPWTDLATVQRLGFSQRDGFWDRLERYYNELSEYDDNVAQDKARKSPKTTRAFRALRALGKTELQYYIQTGIELQDLAINVTNLASIKAMENDLKAFAMKYGAERERQGLTSFDYSDPRWQANAHEGFRHPSATVRERQLARLREKFQQFAGSSGAQLEQLLWNYHQAQKTDPDAPFFTPEQWDNFARQTLADTNATTKANRPSYSQAHPDTAMLTMFWGYSTWLANTMVHELAQVRGTKTGAALTAQLATVLTMLMAATAIGLLALTGKEEWNRRFRNKYSRNPVLTDAEFWGSPRAAATAAGIGAAAMIPVLGSLAMNIQDVRAGGKGYDPGNIFVPISLLGSLATAVRGFAAVPWRDSWIPAEDLLSKIAPRYQETMKLIGRNRASRNASAIIVGAAPEAGIDVPKRGSGGGNIYGPTTGIRRGIDEAVQKMSAARLSGDQRAYDAALKDAEEQRDRLVAYYRDEKGMTQEKAEAAARRDYNELNPVRKAFQGRAITDEEYRRLDAALGTSERGQQARAAVAAWQAGSQALFGVPGSVTKEETAANRPSGGGTRSYGGSSRSSGGGYRRISLTRGSRGGGLVRSPSIRRSRVSTRRFRSGLRRQRLRKVRVKRVRLTA